MLKEWENLVIKWLNCFDLGPGVIETIQDLKEIDFAELLSPSGNYGTRFARLLAYLQSHYPNFDINLSNPLHDSWSTNEGLHSLAALLLLDASVFHPPETFQHNASKIMNTEEQQLIVQFLQKAMNYDQQVTRPLLDNCIPSAAGGIPTVAITPSSPVGARRRSRGTPLADFLSSPVARQKRSGHLRDRLCSLEQDLELEQSDKIELQATILRQNGEIADLVRKYKEKSNEVSALKEHLSQVEAGEEARTGFQSDQKEEKCRLLKDLANSEDYIKQLENEICQIKTNHEILGSKLSALEDKSSEFESLWTASKLECLDLRNQLERQTEANVEFQIRCTQLERDLHQIQLSNVSSPRKVVISSPKINLSPNPESLGFIVERELIEKQNENTDLHQTVKDLNEQLSSLRIVYNELEERALSNNETASRIQKKLEAKVSNIQSILDSTSEELTLCRKTAADLSSQLSDVATEKDELSKQVEQLTTKRLSLLAEQKALGNEKYSLEVQVAQLQAKLSFVVEREDELNMMCKKRSSELEDARQRINAMELEVKKSLNEQSVIELRLNDTLRKLSYAKNIEQEKNDLEEQLANLKQTNEDLQKQQEIASVSSKNLKKQVQCLIDDKKAIESQLKDSSLKRDEAVSSLHELAEERESVVAEKLALLKDKVRWEAELEDAHLRIKEAKEQLTIEEAEKKTLDDRLREALASIESLTANLSIASQQENDLTSQLQDVCKQKKSIENQLLSITRERDTIKSSEQKLSLELEKVTVEREALNRSINSKLSELENMSAQVAVLTNVKANLEVKLAEERATNKKLSTQLLEVEEKLVLARSNGSQAEKDIEALKRECEEKTSHISSLEAEKNDMEDDLCHYGSKLNEKIQENLSLKNDFQGVAEERDDALKKVELLHETRSALSAELELEHRAKEELVSDLHSKEKLLAQYKDSNSVQEVLISELNEKLAVLNHERKSLEDKVISLTGEKEEVSSSLEKLMSDKYASEKDLLAVHDKLKSEVKTLLEEIDEANSRRHLMEEEIVNNNNVIRDLQENLKSNDAEAERKLNSLSNENDGILKKCENLDETLKQLTAENLEKEKEWLSVKDAMTQKMKLLQGQVEESSLKRQLLEKDISDRMDTIHHLEEKLKNSNAEGKMELKNLSEVNHGLLKKCEELEEIVKQLMAEKCETEKNSLAIEHDLSLKIKSLQKQVEEVSSLKELLEKDMGDSAKIIRELEEKLKNDDDDKVKSISEVIDGLLKKCEKLDENVKKLTAEKCETEKESLALQDDMTEKLKSLQEKVEQANSEKESLEKKIGDSAKIIRDLEEKLISNEAEAEKKLKSLTGLNDSTLKKCEKSSKTLEQLQLSIQQQEALLKKTKAENEDLLAQNYELQGSIDVKEELLSDTQKCVEKLRGERDSLRELLIVKDRIISCHKATESSLERQSNDELENAMKLLEGEVHSSQSISEKMAQELRNVQKNFEEEKELLQKALEEAQSTAKTYQQEAVELKQKLSEPAFGGKLAELQQEEKTWKLDRVRNQLEFQFDSMMTQKVDVEEHLNQLREIIKDVSRICDTLFAALPINCDAVHEVTIMKKEVETKLRAVDKKYADSLCSIISLAHDMFVVRRKQIDQTLSQTDSSIVESFLLSEREKMESEVSKSSEAMISLTCDVRSAINSCKFLIERCESYLKAQTRESLKIKTSVGKEGEDTEDALCQNSTQSLTEESKFLHLSDNVEEKNAANFTDDFKNCSDKADWFGGSSTLAEGYHAMKKSHADLENEIAHLRSKVNELQTTVPEQIHNDFGSKIAKLKDKISTLMLRPTQEQLDEKLKELHTQYASKLEGLKLKMKQIVKDEVDKVEEEKQEIVSKYSKRITEFEEHVQQLSAQLWKLGEKLLQEQQDHRSTKKSLDTLHERQRQYLMSKQRTQSLDRLDVILQGTKKPDTFSQLKRRCNSQTAHSGLASTKVHPACDDTLDTVDEGSSRRSTMMAPASMGLAFPEEDEDGEMFNNDYLAELKEGKCRVPADGRLSELQFRNSLCPPHLKSSYPLETQFHDPQALKDEDIKGPDRRLSRQGKDHGTTSYKKPGPPTPSKKAGRLSLQGKEDVTPRVATLRDHNESQTSQASGILRAAKTTPSRLRALFTSSKVANAALHVPKKEENSNPATPTTKRLSIFKKRFGGNKENQSASSAYSSFL